MNSKQQAVMWMGILLIALRFFTDGTFKAVWHTVITADPKSDNSLGGNFWNGFKNGWNSIPGFNISDPGTGLHTTGGTPNVKAV